MSRSAAAWTAAIAVGLLLLAVFLVPSNYLALGPGPACNTVGRGTSTCPSTTDRGRGPLIVVPTAYDHPSDATLALLTVSEGNDRPSIGLALVDWLRPGHAVAPRELFFPPGQSSQQVAQQNRSDMVQAQNTAVAAAEAVLGENRVAVQSVSSPGPSAGVLRAGDILRTVDGKPLNVAPDFVAATPSSTATYAVGITRDGTETTVQLRKGAVVVDPKTGRTQQLFGIQVEDAPTIPVQITLDPTAIGGPSAGMMFALGVYDRLTPGSLTGGTIVAGTGELSDSAGSVGAIGGIQQKMYAARHDVHATLFLAPQANCGDVRGAIPSGLRVVPVSTFQQALSVLADVRAGRTASLPSCG